MSTATAEKPEVKAEPENHEGMVKITNSFTGKTVWVPAPKQEHPVTLGQIVYWYAGGNAGVSPRPAEVMAIGDHALKLFVRSEDGFEPKIGVHHVTDAIFDDPNQVDAKQAGGWDYAPAPVYQKGENEKLLAFLAELAGKVENLEELVAGPAKKPKTKEGQ
jgi:hypothetical protein